MNLTYRYIIYFILKNIDHIYAKIAVDHVDPFEEIRSFRRFISEKRWPPRKP